MFKFLNTFLYWNILHIGQQFRGRHIVLIKDILIHSSHDFKNSIIQKSVWRRKWQPTPVLLPGKYHGQKSLVGYDPWGCKELDTTEWLHFLSFQKSVRLYFSKLHRCIFISLRTISRLRVLSSIDKYCFNISISLVQLLRHV